MAMRHRQCASRTRSPELARCVLRIQDEEEAGDQREFHDFLLRNGAPIPLEIVEGQVNAWLQQKKA